MTRELFVSSTPHETRVGLVEDDLLAEVYLERENEYTLAGSIYKGRVTRVLPGMQSAFVEIGLERDAFLYVSDFMELQDEDEVEVDEIPAGRNVAEQKSYSEPHTGTPLAESPSFAAAAPEETSQGAPLREAAELAEGHERAGGSEEREGRGDWRSRRRRRGRRGERMPESKFARPAAESPREPSRPVRTERPEYGPPAGYQPILLPGESISKYQRLSQTQAPSRPRTEPHPPARRSDQPVPDLGQVFPEDEPLFTAGVTAAPDDHQPQTPSVEQGRAFAAAASDRHESESARSDRTDGAPTFPGAAQEQDQQPRTDFPTTLHTHPDQIPSASTAGTMEEEEIEEDEADLAHYVEDLEEDAAFEEMEEETRAAEDYREGAPREIAASGESATEAQPLSHGGDSQPDEFAAAGAEAGAGQTLAGGNLAAEDEAGPDDEESEEAELEEAQAEAEALLDAEARGNGSADARVEVRAGAGTAPYTQRAARPAFDRRNQRGRRGGRRFSRRNTPQNIPQITDLLKEGQEILVQIAKEPIGKKGARITSHIALPGRFLVYMPTVNHTGVSRKIASEEERQRLKRIIISERENGHGGFIVRTAAQGASEDELRADIRFLKGLWSEIKTRAETDKSPALIYHDLNVVERILRDQVTSDFNTIWVDNEQEYERILRFANRFQPALVKRVKLYTKETPLFEQFGLSEEINKALKSKVWLKSGGYIVINQTEALVAIDVNTGKYVGKTARLEDTIVKTNVDAIKEIVRQIRLRDLGGIIIIDFIDMDERRNRQKVMQALEEALRGDRAPSKVLQFNDFGLVAITRKRVKQSLERTIGAPCPYCQSTGFVKSVTTVCNEIYLEMRKIAKHLEHADVMLRVNPEVAKALKANNGRALTEMEELTKRTVIVKSDPALHQEQFDIN
jgi:Rne/Rng family ribonuclease